MFTTTRSLIPESREWYRRVIRKHRPSQTSSKERAATQYARNKLVDPQEKFDQLEELGLFKHPEDIGITIEYLNPSLLVKKQSGGYRLITAFADVGRYSKPQPSVMPDVDSILHHIAQWKHLISTFEVPCQDVTGQVCAFIHRTQESVVRQTSIQNILHGHARLPFTTRASWLAIQSETKDLRRTHAHLVKGTRPSKKLTSVKDIKRYLNVATIAKNGLLVVKRDEPFTCSRECIIVPRQVLDGLLTALHIQLSHP